MRPAGLQDGAGDLNGPAVPIRSSAIASSYPHKKSCEPQALLRGVSQRDYTGNAFIYNCVSRPPVVEGKRQDHHTDVISYNTNRCPVSCSKRHPSPPENKAHQTASTAEDRNQAPSTSAPGPQQHTRIHWPQPPPLMPPSDAAPAPVPPQRTRVAAGPLPELVPQTPGSGAYPGFRSVGFQGGTDGREKVFRRLHTALLPPSPFHTGGYKSRDPRSSGGCWVGGHAGPERIKRLVRSREGRRCRYINKPGEPPPGRCQDRLVRLPLMPS